MDSLRHAIKPFLTGYVFENNWKQMRGQTKIWWGKITDDDLDKLQGDIGTFLGLLQEKYDHFQRQAEADTGGGQNDGIS